MCTLTIKRTDKRILVTMNRDEQRSRRDEVSPFLWTEPRIFAPQDGQAHGTWIGMNECGDVAALLNGYQKKDKKQGIPSRGEIVPKILSGQSIHPDKYASFDLVYVHQDYIKYSHWNGRIFEEKILSAQDWIFLTSSSWNQDEVKIERQKKFDQWVLKGADFEHYLPIIHCQHDRTQKAHSVLMTREDACTKSITQFEICDNYKICRYWKKPEESRNYRQFKVLF